MADSAQTPTRALRAEIARRKATLKLLPGGFGSVMDLLDAWVASVDARLTLQEGQGGAIEQFSRQLSESEADSFQKAIERSPRRVCEGCDE